MEVPDLAPFLCTSAFHFFGNPRRYIERRSEQTSKQRKDRVKNKSPDFPVNGLPDRQTGVTQVTQPAPILFTFRNHRNSRRLLGLNQRRVNAAPRGG
ncbi:hypothetical protein CEXT_133301 [Caerostris extrusa]|uniref:Uncharacterized protein n=1 Tax=Caerostris extrusa TaxID=172846 RepID=A0AAV4YAV6_CAEEX|nr:hypothetical protein CEXT_133301 [Caerostris extrusa]